MLATRWTKSLMSDSMGFNNICQCTGFMSEYLWLTSQYHTSDGMSLSTFNTVLYCTVLIYHSVQCNATNPLTEM